MPRETNTIRTKDDRDNGIVFLLILFLFLFELAIGFLTYLNGPLLVAGKPDTKFAAVGITIQDVDITNTEISTETIVYEEPKKQVPQIKAPEVKPDEPVQSVIPPETASITEVAVASTTEVTIAPDTATSSHAVPAVDVYTLTYIAGDGGYLVGSTTQAVVHGGIGTEVTAVPNNGYNFYSWSDGSVVSSRTDKLTSDSEFTANFVRIIFRRSHIQSQSNIATITSGTYIVSAGGTANETITGVPFGTDKATFLPALTKGQVDQTWNDTSINDPVVSNDTLVVTAQDGTTVVTYTVTVNDPPPPGGPG